MMDLSTQFENRTGRQNLCFDFDWRFFLEADEAIQAQGPDVDDRGWPIVQTPHDFSIGRPFDKDAPAGGRGGHLPGGVGWYRKRFSIPQALAGKRVYVEFDGVYRNSDVWCNGVHLGRRAYGYSSFRYELTEHLEFGQENLIAVRVDNADQPNCRWYSGSGIYRHVRLVVTEAVAVAPWGLYFAASDVLGQQATLRAQTTLRAAAACKVQGRVVTDLLSPDAEPIASAQSDFVAAGGEDSIVQQELSVSSPKLWSPQSPLLYEAVTRVFDAEGTQVDEVRTRVGLRQIELHPEKGFLLNGEVTVLKGGNIHHDGGCVGAAVPESIWRSRLQAIKAVGGNTVRFSHNPPAPEVLDLCDELGLLAYDEAFDKWAAPLEPVPWLTRVYPTFEQDWKRDLEAMLYRDRNHPCVVFWSVGNEVVEYADPAQCIPIYKRLSEHVKQIDPTRPVTLALQYVGNRQEALHDSGLADLVDFISVNYQEMAYEDDRRQQPGKLILGSETKPYFTTARDSHVAKFLPRNPWRDVQAHDYVIGGLLWPIIDYIGEANWPCTGWTGGILDSTGKPKASSNFFQCAWSDKPQVRIQVRDETLPIQTRRLSWDCPRVIDHWNWPEKKEQLLHVETPSNCEEVQLLLNGQSCGLQRVEKTKNCTIDWYVPYEEGTIEALGRIDGKEVCRWSLETTGPAVKLQVLTDRESYEGDGHDAMQLEILVVDQQGRRVMNREVDVSLDVLGCGELLGMDNGDQITKQPYRCPRRRTHFGRCYAVVRPYRGQGRIRIRANCETLEPGEALVTVG
jgi:beta-galactosidase